MNRTKWILALMTILLIGSGAGVLARYKSVQHLGDPGVVTRPIPGSKNLEVVLPEKVPGFTYEWMPQAAIVTNVLPKDTSYGQCRYSASDDFWVQTTVVLMGTDRGSMHKPQFCLTGAGWNITKTEVVSIPLEKPAPYDLPVIKLTASTLHKENGREQQISGIYVYWYVCEDKISASPTGTDRMWSMAKNLMTTGVLERWAYISYFTPCHPGMEDAAFERTKKLIAASVPEFQLVHGGVSHAQK
jgi:hypothetical protein